MVNSAYSETATAAPRTSRWGSGILHAQDDLFLGALFPFSIRIPVGGHEPDSNGKQRRIQLQRSDGGTDTRFVFARLRQKVGPQSMDTRVTGVDFEQASGASQG